MAPENFGGNLDSIRALQASRVGSAPQRADEVPPLPAAWRLRGLSGLGGVPFVAPIPKHQKVSPGTHLDIRRNLIAQLFITLRSPV